MVSAFAALCLAFVALDLFSFLDTQCSAGTSTATSAESPLLHTAAEAFMPLAVVLVLFVVVLLTCHHLSRRHASAVPVAGAGNGRRSISGFLMFVLCVSAGTLEFIVFGAGAGQAAGGGTGHGAQLARALGLAALRALPAAATGTFFSGMALIIVSHVRAGGEGGGTGTVGGDGAIQGLPRLLTKVAAGEAAALVGLMLVALTLLGAKC